MKYTVHNQDIIPYDGSKEGRASLIVEGDDDASCGKILPPSM